PSSSSSAPPPPASPGGHRDNVVRGTDARSREESQLMGTSLPILNQAQQSRDAVAPPKRRASRQVHVGPVAVGGGAPVSVQSMTTTPTHDVNATLQQIAALNAAGVDIVRVAVSRQEDANALATIAAKSTVPVIADI